MVFDIRVGRVCVLVNAGVCLDREGLRFTDFRIQRWHIVDFERGARFLNCNKDRL